MKRILTTIFVAATLVAGAASAAQKPSIALVHGAFEDASIWQGTQAKLQADGYKVIAVNLPGRPSSPLSPDKATIELYRDTVLKAIEGERRPVVLVGHSFGGFTISAVAEAAPKKVKTLIYLAAYLPQQGDSLLSLANVDRDSKMGPHVQIMKEKGLAAIELSARADLFANDGSDGLRKAIPELILDEPLGPLAEPAKLTKAHFGVVDKAYIHTSRDQVVSPYLQTAMVGKTPVRKQLTLDTGHTPFLTQPDALASAIETLSK